MTYSFDPMHALEDYFAGELLPEDAQQLRAWIEAHPENFAEVADRTRIHGMLSASGVRVMTDNIMEEVLAEQAVVSDIPAKQALPKSSRSMGRAVVLVSSGVAVSLALVFTAVVVYMLSPSGPVATVVTTEDVVWNSTPLESGQAIEQGEIHIESGHLKVKLKSEAELKIDGAVRLDVVDAKKVQLHHGTARFHCPPEAHGFVVKVPGDVEVIDLGTDFKVSVTPDGKSRIVVTQGQVEVRAAGEPAVTLNAGEQVAIRNSGEQRIGEVAKVDRAGDWRQAMQDWAKQRAAFLVLPLDGDGVPLTPDLQPQMIGNVTPATDRFGQARGAVHFDGQGAALKFPVGWPTNQYTLSCWIRAEEVGGGQYVVAVEADDGRLATRRLWMNRPGIKADAFVRGLPGHGRANAVGNARAMGGSGKIETDRWTHVVVTFSRRNENHAYLAFYVDGKRTSENTFDYRAGEDPIATGLTLGQSPLEPSDQSNFKGDLDDMLLLSRELSAAEVLSLYEASRAQQHPPEETPKGR